VAIHQSISWAVFYHLSYGNLMSDNSDNELLILGGGIAGISAGYHAQINGFSNTVYEGSNKPGGLTGNFEVSGFRFDNAIHMSFTKEKYVRQIFDRTPYFKHRPDAYCLENDKWMKHPVQNNLYPLEIDDKVNLIESFTNRPTSSPKNYKEWLYSQYGEALSNRYPIPYTRKYWGLEPEKLSLEWVGNRMRKANFSEVLSGALESKDENHFYAGEMRYPKKGGYYEFIRAVAESTNIQCDKKAVKIDTLNKVVHCSDGSSTKYKDLISSLPLPLICSLIDNCPEEVKEAAGTLLWTTVDLISIGFKKESVPPYLWFYLYDSENLAARGYSPSMKSPDNAPDGCSSLQFEIYNLSSKDRLEPEDLKKNILENLLNMKICDKDDILFTHHKHLPYGNIVFDHGMEDRRQVVLDYLSSIDVLTCGRFGAWEYYWSDQSFMSGKEAAAKFIEKFNA
jgi:protoporphyrinogen oxidase